MSTANIPLSNNITLFPNPLTANLLNIFLPKNFTTTNIKVSTYNLLGNKLTSSILIPENNTISLELPNLGAGIYLLILEEVTTKTKYCTKFIKV